MAKTEGPLVVHVLPALRFGGFETLARALIAGGPSGLRSVVVCTDLAEHVRDMAPVFEDDGVEVVYMQYDPVNEAACVDSLAGFFTQRLPVGMIVYRFGDQRWVARAAERASVFNLVSHVGTMPLPAQIPYIRSICEDPTLSHIPIHFCSRAVETAYRRFCWPPSGSQTVYNGLDVRAFSREVTWAQDDGPSPSIPVRREGTKNVIGMVGRVVDSKDHRTLLRGFRYLLDLGVRDTDLWIIGNGELLESTKQYALGVLELGDSVKFLGGRGDIPQLLAQLDVFAFSALPIEGLGNALVEALAAGLPIVATDAPACCEVLGTHAGRFVPCGDWRVMGYALREVLSNGDERARLRAAACERRWIFDIKHCADAYYGKLLAEPPAGRGRIVRSPALLEPDPSLGAWCRTGVDFPATCDRCGEMGMVIGFESVCRSRPARNVSLLQPHLTASGAECVGYQITHVQPALFESGLLSLTYAVRDLPDRGASA